MEAKQITLETIYKAIQNLQYELHNIKEKLDEESEFTNEENREFIEGTREAWKEIDEDKYTTYSSSEEFLSTLKEKNADNKRN
ncbi:MAG: hypothetical protein AABX83_02560 [Nanoarchaeota archaeon]